MPGHRDLMEQILFYHQSGMHGRNAGYLFTFLLSPWGRGRFSFSSFLTWGPTFFFFLLFFFMEIRDGGQAFGVRLFYDI